MLLETKISRRAFLQTTGALTFSFTFFGQATKALAQDGAAKFNAWVSIAGDGTVTVMVPVAEMGQGALTSLPLILAEELDADWSKVTMQYAPPVAKVYGNYHPLFQGAMITAASISTPGYWNSMRTAGAQARRVLLDNVAQHWSVPVSELSTEPSMVVHKASGRKISYGEVVRFAKVPETPPQISEADLKKPAQFRLIGKEDASTCRRRPTARPSTASTCACRACCTPRCWRRRTRAPRPRRSTATKCRRCPA
jgi:isoquinoline 1-oxidoreductase beta subunit